MKIRWRLVIGLLSLAATVALTAPTAASRALVQPVSDIWPNPDVPLIQEILPNAFPTLDIWPNLLLIDGSGGSTTPGE